MRSRGGSIQGSTLTAFLVLSLSGCDGGPQPTDARSEYDSAGVRVVELAGLPETRAFHTDEIYRHGWAPGEFQFANLYSGALLSDGSAALGDLGLQKVVQLSPDGRLIGVVGQGGEGPEEFGRILSVFALPGDTVLVEDDGNLRVVAIHDGRFTGSYSTGGARLARATRGAGMTSGRIVGMPTSYRLLFDEDWLTAPITKHTAGEVDFDSIGVFDFPSKVDLARPDPFRPFGSLGAGQGHVLVTRGDRSEVRLLGIDSGELSTIVRWPPRALALSDSLWQAYVFSRTDGSPETASEMENRRTYVAEPLPEVELARGDDSERIWVRRWSPDGTPVVYDLFDQDLRPLGWVELPPRALILAIRGDLLLSRQLDGLDVDAAVVYRLRSSSN